MGFSKLCKRIAIIIFLLAFIGAFFVAKEVSTTQETYESLFSSRTSTLEETNSSKYIIVLLVSWIMAGIICLYIYGLGEIIERLDHMAYPKEPYNNDLLDRLKK